MNYEDFIKEIEWLEKKASSGNSDIPEVLWVEALKLKLELEKLKTLDEIRNELADIALSARIS